MPRPFLRVFVTLFLSALSATAVQADDIVLADFEDKTYPAGWKTEGMAFGTGPAQGTLPGQMEVSGFLDKGLVNSFLGGDKPTGKLTSPKFKIERQFLSFLIGGGGHQGLAVNLIVDDKTVRTATGPNIVPGGSERLDWTDWDVAKFQDKEAFIVIIDNATGGWGHINVDHIIQTNRRHTPVEKRNTFVVEENFLHLPVTMKAPLTWIRVEADGQQQLEFDIPLTVSGTPDFYANLQTAQWNGKKITLIAERVAADSEGLDLVKQDSKMAQEDSVYTEKYRPQFHFSPRTGWTNDPNGLVYYDGTYHLFFQHNPYSVNWGNMTWGHATSSDLLHWTELPDAVHPDKLGTVYSGSAVVDWKNTSGFQSGNEKAIVLIYTADGPSARFGAKASQCIAYSTDAGKTFVKYEGNPVVEHIIGGNRDPKVIWYEPEKQWVMALYLDKEDYALFGSKDLKRWNKIGGIENLGCSECPDFFPLAVDGNKENKKWVFWGANGKYLIGSFDGKQFKPETEPLTVKFGGNDYAAQTYSDAPNDRRIQISWMNGGIYPDMPFNQQFSIPRELTLRTTPNGTRLFTEPVKEVEALRKESKKFENITVQKGKTELLPFDFTLFDAEIVLDINKTEVNEPATVLPVITVDVMGQKIIYNSAEKKISLENITAPLTLKDGKWKLRILVDRTSVEIFAQDGEVQIAKCFLPADDFVQKGMTVYTARTDIVIEKATVWKMQSVWKR